MLFIITYQVPIDATAERSKEDHKIYPDTSQVFTTVLKARVIYWQGP